MDGLTMLIVPKLPPFAQVVLDHRWHFSVSWWHEFCEVESPRMVNSPFHPHTGQQVFEPAATQQKPIKFSNPFNTAQALAHRCVGSTLHTLSLFTANAQIYCAAQETNNMQYSLTLPSSPCLLKILYACWKFHKICFFKAWTWTRLYTVCIWTHLHVWCPRQFIERAFTPLQTTTWGETSQHPRKSCVLK